MVVWVMVAEDNVGHYYLCGCWVPHTHCQIIVIDITLSLSLSPFVCSFVCSVHSPGGKKEGNGECPLSHHVHPLLHGISHKHHWIQIRLPKNKTIWWSSLPSPLFCMAGCKKLHKSNKQSLNLHHYLFDNGLVCSSTIIKYIMIMMLTHFDNTTEGLLLLNIHVSYHDDQWKFIDQHVHITFQHDCHDHKW